jgi:hypothetical protein
MDASLAFWLQYVDSEGGLHEGSADRVLVMLPSAVQQACAAPEEMLVTSDPDVAREDGATLLGPGHPILSGAADHVLASGDVGVLTIPRPASVPPSAEVLLEKARDQFPVDHGKIDLAGGIRPSRRIVVRAGVLVEYSVSAETRFQERAESWVDAGENLELTEAVQASLARAAGRIREPLAGDTTVAAATESLRLALAEAHRLIDARARLRLAELAGEATADHAGEQDRACAYYDAALASIARRRANAAPDRAALLEARAESTRQERDRRLAEIAEKYQPRHEIRPFRLHALVVPAMHLPVHVRRGERRYPLELDWLLPAGKFAGLRCPHCREPGELVASKSRLGCRSCLPATPVSVPAPAGGRAAAMSRARRPGTASPAGSARTSTADGSTASPGAARAEPARPTPGRAAPAPASVQPRWPASEPKQTPVVPTATLSQLSETQVCAAGERLVLSFWRAAAAQSKKLRVLCSEDSPAAAAVTMFGGYGPFRAIGLPPTDPATSVQATFTSVRPDDWTTTTGAVATEATRYVFQMTWHFENRRAVVDEIKPLGHQFGSDGPMALLFRSAPELFAELPAPRVPLDGVARQVWKVALPRRGLPLVLRCLAAWWRIAGAPGQPTRLASVEFDDYPAALVASAIERLVGYRATGSGAYAEAATAYQVSEPDLRKITPVLQRHLQLSARRPW